MLFRLSESIVERYSFHQTGEYSVSICIHFVESNIDHILIRKRKSSLNRLFESLDKVKVANIRAVLVRSFIFRVISEFARFG